MPWLVVSLVLTPVTPAFAGKQSMEDFDEVHVPRMGPDKMRLRRVRGQALRAPGEPVIGDLTFEQAVVLLAPT